MVKHNLVLVYHIKTSSYVTISNMNENGECNAYELNGEIPFGEFNHEKHKYLEGRSFFVNEEGLNMMVSEINKQIQLHRPIVDSGPVHIVSMESAAGSLRVGLPRPRTVIGFPDSLSIGPISNLHTEAGRSHRNEWLYENINSEQEDNVLENQIMNTLREIEDIAPDGPIYVWYGNNAIEQVGLRFFLYQLREKTNVIFLINSPELYESSKDEEPIFYTSQIESSELSIIFEKNKKPLSDEERTRYHIEWEQLSETNEVLRIWEDNEIKSVSEDYYDTFIIETLEEMHLEQEQKDFIKTADLIGEILTRNLQIDIFYLESRIRHLVYSKVFELKGIPKSMRHYSVKLR
ncbi:DUF1835 domain-containing protein [Bacillus yapensis]|uniref:DUF1835 domain-containing protein n=1 Tax=Bacillus yapensis TaxID=2492960 RepID=UPI001BAEBA46|nr:DUF1835 domain-containing protein [Bacillus yapensis]